MLPLTALLAGVALLLAGSGLLGTLLAVRGGLEGFDEQTLGLVMSGYFAGFFLGTYAAPPLIRRIGHVRAFAFYTGLCAIAVLVHPLWVDPWAWFGLRLLTGAALVGLYTVIESWLNAQPDRQYRSRIFAIYMAVNLTALAGGQLLLGFGVDRGFALFSLVAILVCAAALPVTLTRLAQPSFPPTPRLGLSRLYRTAPAATASAGLSGLAMGAFWGLGPTYAGQLGLDRSGIAWFMVATIMGGALLQWPLGRLSDRVDRRIGLALACALAASLALFAGSVVTWSPGVLFAAFFAYGGLAFSIYPMSVAHMLDTLPADDLLAGCSSLLLVHGIGATLGPALAGQAMSRLGPSALPLYFACVLGLLTLYLLLRLSAHRRIRLHRSQFHPMLRTTPGALELLAETESDPPRKEDA
ncbi:MFS transporter [Arenimonas terrae]|uniref:MFS transporter n=1 Tax=Arenimonas terrae TaxID=2546226 RepID=A0A5C4RXX9_9GAMM|nr:MFS transporter [Arenimonas terrae]TNJ35865.1 MFS transporter [Arenimonas terrae]